MGSGSNCDFVDEEESRTPLLAHLSERPEQGERVWMHFGALWVPLDTHDPTTFRAFHGFHDAVRGARSHSQGRREPLFRNPLMVARVHAKGSVWPINIGQAAGAVDNYVMPIRGAILVPAVLVALDVLHE